MVEKTQSNTNNKINRLMPRTNPKRITSPTTTNIMISDDDGDGKRKPRHGKRKPPFRHVVAHKGRPIYQWEQTAAEVTIYFPAPPSKSTAFCNISDDFVQLGALTKGLPCSWFLNHYTGGTVKQNKSYWNNNRGTDTCTIVLAKAKPGSPWRYALRDERDETTRHSSSRPPVRPLGPRPTTTTPTTPTTTRKPPLLPPRRNQDTSPVSPTRQATRSNITDASPVSPRRHSRNISPVSPRRDNKQQEEPKQYTSSRQRRKGPPPSPSAKGYLSSTPVSRPSVTPTTRRDNTSAGTSELQEGAQHLQTATATTTNGQQELVYHGQQQQKKKRTKKKAGPNPDSVVQKNNHHNNNNNNSTKVVYMQKILKEKDLELNAQRSHLQQLNQRIQELEQEKSKPQQQETIEEEVPDESIQKLQRELKESKLENQQEVDALEFSKLKTQAQLDQQTEVANTLQEELAEHKINLQEQQILIDTQALSMQTKEKLIQLLEAQLEGQTQTQRRLLGEDEYSSDELVKTKQAWNDSQLQVQQLQGEHKKARKQIRNLETELDEQLSEWRVMEKDMEDAQARVGTLQAQLAAKEKDPTRTNIAFKENSVNEHLDRLSRKMVEARSQLEEVHRRRKQNLMQQERRVAPVDVLSSARTR
jgi:hypothetical protein